METISDFKQKVLDEQVQNIKADILRVAPDVHTFKVHSESTEMYNIFIVYGIQSADVFTHVCCMRMIMSSYADATKVYDSFTFLGSERFDLKDAKVLMQVYLGNALRQLEKAVS